MLASTHFLPCSCGCCVVSRHHDVCVFSLFLFLAITLILVLLYWDITKCWVFMWTSVYYMTTISLMWPLQRDKHGGNRPFPSKMVLNTWIIVTWIFSECDVAINGSSFLRLTSGWLSITQLQSYGIFPHCMIFQIFITYLNYQHFTSIDFNLLCNTTVKMLLVKW